MAHRDGGRPPVKTKKRVAPAQRMATVDAAKQFLVTAPIFTGSPVPQRKPRGVVPYRYKGQVAAIPAAPERGKPASLQQQYQWAKHVLISKDQQQTRRSRTELAKTMGPAEVAMRRRALRLPAPAPPPPSLAHRVAHGALGAIEDVNIGPLDIGDLIHHPGRAVLEAGGRALAPTFTPQRALIEAYKHRAALEQGARGIPGVVRGAGELAWREARGIEAAGVRMGLQASAASGRHNAAVVPKQIREAEAGLPVNRQVVANLGANIAGGVYAHRHPVKALKADIQYINDGLVGLTQLPAMVTALAASDLTLEQRSALAHDMWDAVVGSIISDIGPDATVQSAFKAGEEEPAAALGRLAMIIDPEQGALGVLGRSVGSLTRFGRRAAGGEAFAHSPDRVRMLRNADTGEVIPIPAARSTIARNTIQRGYDLASRGVERFPGHHAPVVGRLATTRRAERAQRRIWDRERQRLPAEAQALMHDVEAVVRQRWGRLSGPDAVKLAILQQKPKGVTDDEFLRAALENYKEMLDSGEFELAGKPASPALVRARNRYTRLQRRADVARQRRRARTVKDIAREQARLTGALDDLNKRRAQVREELAAVESDTEMSGSERAGEIENLNAARKALDAQAKIIREDLNEISVDEAPVAHPNRTAWEQAMRASSKISDEETEGLLHLGDSAARNRARVTGEDPGEWWAQYPVQRASQEHVEGRAVEGALTQQRGVVAPERFTTADALPLLDKYTPVKQRGVKRPKIAGLPKTIKSRADFGRLLEDMAGRLEAGLDFAKEWYSNSSREILAATGGDVDRADLIAQVTAIYSPQKPVAPNIALALRVIRDVEEGRGVRYGNKHQRALARQAVRGEDWLSSVKPNQLPKVRRFYANLLKGIDPERLAQHGFTGREVTVDGWMGAAFGYGYNTGNSGLTEAQFRVVEDVVQRLADHYGIEPEQAQAAIWTSIKAERDRSLAPLYANPETRQQALEKAGQSFADAIFTPKNTLRLPLESMTSEKPWMNDLTPEQLASHTAEYGNATLAVLHDEGFIARRDPGGISFWRDPETNLIERNPATAIEIAMGDRPVTRMAGGEVIDQTARGLYLRVPPGMQETASGLASALGDAAKQAQAAWARYLNPRGNAGDVTSYRLELGRSLTDEETQRLTDALHEDFHFTVTDEGGIIAFNDPDSILDRSIHTQARLKAGEKKESAAARRELGRLATERKAHVDRAVEAAIGDEEATIVDLAHRGELIDSGEYQARLSQGRRSDLYQRVRDRLSAAFEEIDQRFRDDPVAASARAEHFPGGAALDDAARGRGPPHLLSQSRRGDVLGATEWLDGPAGRRVVYLTENADASTVLHELFGHAADEMKELHPEEFAEIEAHLGPYAEWARDEHETFARWAERYFLEGYAPTPELVPLFARVKQWMRTIYHGMTKALGRSMPPATRDLFDRYFGGYAEENVARIAMNMAPGDTRALTEFDAAAGAAAAALSDLESLEKRIATNAAKRSFEGKKKRLDELAAKEEKGDLDEGEQMEQIKLTALVLSEQSKRDYRADKRTKSLRSKISDLEDALAKPHDSEEYVAAREAMQQLAADREAILREAFGTQYDEVFSNRVDLLADWLTARGLLRKGWAPGSASYYPMTTQASRIKSLFQPAVALEGRVVGQAKKTTLGLHQRNEMILWQRGDWNADPAVLFESYMRALGWSWANEVKTRMWKMGRPLTPEEKNGTTPLGDVRIINPHGSPISMNLREKLNAISAGEYADKTTTASVQAFLDGVEGGDDRMLFNSLQDYWANVVLDPATKTFPPELLAVDGLRVLDSHTVEALMRPLRGGSTRFGRGWDVVTSLARWSLIYANVPGYWIVNGIGNTSFLAAQQGIFLPRSIGYMRRLLKNKKLADRIGAETGELPLVAAAQRGRGGRAGTKAVEQKTMHFIGLIDRYPRGAAWMYEASKRGYKTDAEMVTLMEGKTPKTIRDREAAAEATRNHMVDFDRLNDFERQWLTRVLFVYPWIRGATAWPFWYGKNYPVRTAVALGAGNALEERRKKMLGPTPSYYDALVPTAVYGTKEHRRAKVVPGGPFSPTQTAVDEMRLLWDVVSGNTDRDAAALISALAPSLRTGIEGLTGRDEFGKKQSLWELLKDPRTIGSIVPLYRLANAIVRPDSATPKIYTGKATSRFQSALRTFVRVTPEEISIPRLNAQAYNAGSKTTSEKIDEATKKLEADWKKIVDNEPMPRTIRISQAIKFTYEGEVSSMKKRLKNRDWDPQPLDSGGFQKDPDLSPLQDAHLLWATIKHFLPAMDIPAPEALLREDAELHRGTFVANEVLRRYREHLYNGFIGKPSSFQAKVKKGEAAGVLP